MALAILGIAASAVLYQNCSGQTQTTGSHPQSSCETDCTGSIELRIQNTSPVAVRTSDSHVDIAGFCNVRGYSYSKIYYRLIGTGVSDAEYDSGAGCNELGRFHIQLPLPSAYVRAETYQVNLRLFAFDDQGDYHSNPSGAHKDSIRLAPATF